MDDGLIICSHCGNPPNAEKEQNLSSLNIDSVAKQVYRKLLKNVIAWLGFLSLLFGIGLYQAYQNAVKIMENILVERTVYEFEQPRIRKTIQEVAKENAKYILQKEIKPEVIKFREEVQNKIELAEDLIKKTQNQLENLTTLIEIEDSVRFGSRAAFEKLVRLGNHEDYYGVMAKRRVQLIKNELYNFKMIPGAYFNLEWTIDGVKKSASDLSTNYLFHYLEKKGIPKEHYPSLMADISSKKPKDEICIEAVRIFSTSDNLYCAVATASILTKIYGPIHDLLEFDQWLDFCKSEISKKIYK